MKTNQVLTRELGDFDVLQRTSDGFFNATSLIKQWNNISPTERKMDNYFKLQGTEEFVSTIMEKENLHTPKLVYVKSRASRGSNAGTWMHPLLFIDFAMWINPAFKYDVLKFVYDQLIQYRNEAGNTYREMAAQIASISKKGEVAQNISKIATGINHIVYNAHEKDIRNKKAEENSMKELMRLQVKVTELIKEGFIKNYTTLIEYLRGLWIEKYQPKELTE